LSESAVETEEKILTAISGPDTGPVNHDPEDHQGLPTRISRDAVGHVQNLQVYLNLEV
jgi:hypothetical protein